MGQGTGLSKRPIGQSSGDEMVTLDLNTLPTHTHLEAGQTSSGAIRAGADTAGGDNCIITSEPAYAGSDLFLRSNEFETTSDQAINIYSVQTDLSFPLKKIHV